MSYMRVTATPIPTDIQEGLRALRLWHWRQCLMNRTGAESITYDSPVKDTLNLHADFHLAQVQLLNEFFPVGDTAEGDDK
mgnify:CR=1 FL=1